MGNKASGQHSHESEAEMSIFKEPQCLIETDESGILRARQDVLAELQYLDKPMVAISIAGLYRTGKSYLMNRLGSASKGFALGNTIESKTKGIWIWVRQHPVRENTYLLLLDTEGLGDADKGNPDHDNWIFTLAVLLSSTFVYNFLGAIDETMFSKLHFISQISKKVKIHTKGTEGDNIDLDMYFPQLILTARDFTLSLEIAGKKVTADDYLEHMLGLRDNQVKDSQEARKCIRQYFATRKCFVFDSPGDRSTVKKLDTLKEKHLAKSFVGDTKAFTGYIWNKCPTLALPNGDSINGLMFATLVEMYIGSIQQGEVPCMESAFTVMARRENEKVIAEVLNACYRQIKESGKVPTETEEELAKLFERGQKEAVDAFVSRAIYDVEGTFKQVFLDKLHEACSKIEEENRAHSRSRCEEVLGVLGQPVKEKHNNGLYMKPGGYELYTKDLAALSDQYNKKKKLGVLKNQMLAEFLKDEDVHGNMILRADQKLSEEEKQREETRIKLAQQESKSKKQEDKIRQLQEKNELQTRIAEETTKKMQEKLEKEVQLREAKIKEIEDKRKEEIRRLEKEGQKNVDALRKDQEESEKRYKMELEKVQKDFEENSKKHRQQLQTRHDAELAKLKKQIPKEQIIGITLGPLKFGIDKPKWFST